MESLERRTGRFGRWTPILLYAIIVFGWFAEGVAHASARDHLWLILWTIPAPLFFLWRTRRHR